MIKSYGRRAVDLWCLRISGGSTTYMCLSMTCNLTKRTKYESQETLRFTCYKNVASVETV